MAIMVPGTKKRQEAREIPIDSRVGVIRSFDSFIAPSGKPTITIVSTPPSALASTLTQIAIHFFKVNTCNFRTDGDFKDKIPPYLQIFLPLFMVWFTVFP